MRFALVQYHPEFGSVEKNQKKVEHMLLENGLLPKQNDEDTCNGGGGEGILVFGPKSCEVVGAQIPDQMGFTEKNRFGDPNLVTLWGPNSRPNGFQ